MTDLGTQIRDALREQDDERLPADEVLAIRRVVVASVRAEEGGTFSWLRPLAVAATVIAMIAAGVTLGERFDARDSAGAGESDATSTHAAVKQAAGARQLHFSTPGGTRIIWIFNSDLDLKTTP
jgi:hypothetical protein